MLPFADGTEEGSDFYEIKEEFKERYGTPKRFFITVWELTEEKIKENIRNTEKAWPILLVIGLGVVALLSLPVTLICG